MLQLIRWGSYSPYTTRALFKLVAIDYNRQVIQLANVKRLVRLLNEMFTFQPHLTEWPQRAFYFRGGDIRV